MPREGNSHAERVSLTKLTPAQWNPRKIKDDRFDNLCASIKADPDFLRLRPILAQSDGTIYAGNMRWHAAKHLGMSEVWAIVEDVPEQLAKERALRDNAAWGENVDDQLGELMAELKSAGSDIDLLGFESAELDRLLGSVTQLPDEDEADLEPPSEPITKPGDLWLLGDHRVACIDSTHVDALTRLMNGRTPQMVFADPPYGVNIVGENGQVGAGNLAVNGVYAPVAGDDSTQSAQDVCGITMSLWPNSVQVWWGANYYADHLPPSSCWLIWDKREGMTSNNFADCELAWVSKHSPARVFAHRWNGMLKASERGERRVHPTQKPVALAGWVFDTYGKKADLIFDPFLGSGMSLIAAEQMGRTVYGCELSPAYCDVICNRWAKLTGKMPILAKTHEVQPVGR